MATTKKADIHAVAAACNVGDRTVRNWKKEKDFPPLRADGSHDVPAIQSWYIARMTAQLDARGAPIEPEALRAARIRLVAEQATKVDLFNKVASGELVESRRVEGVLGRKISNTRQRLRAIPSSLGPQLTHKPAAYIESRLLEAVNQALQELEGDVAAESRMMHRREMR